MEITINIKTKEKEENEEYTLNENWKFVKDNNQDWNNKIEININEYKDSD